MSSLESSAPGTPDPEDVQDTQVSKELSQSGIIGEAMPFVATSTEHTLAFPPPGLSHHDLSQLIRIWNNWLDSLPHSVASIHAETFHREFMKAIGYLLITGKVSRIPETIRDGPIKDGDEVVLNSIARLLETRTGVKMYFFNMVGEPLQELTVQVDGLYSLFFDRHGQAACYTVKSIANHRLAEFLFDEMPAALTRLRIRLTDLRRG